MKLSELPEQYKIYELFLSNGKTFYIDGDKKIKILKATNNFIQLEDGSGFNKAFIVSWKIDVDKTRENASEHREKLIEIENKLLLDNKV